MLPCMVTQTNNLLEISAQFLYILLMSTATHLAMIPAYTSCDILCTYIFYPTNHLLNTYGWTHSHSPLAYLYIIRKYISMCMFSCVCVWITSTENKLVYLRVLAYIYVCCSPMIFRVYHHAATNVTTRTRNCWGSAGTRRREPRNSTPRTTNPSSWSWSDTMENTHNTTNRHTCPSLGEQKT